MGCVPDRETGWSTDGFPPVQAQGKSCPEVHVHYRRHPGGAVRHHVTLPVLGTIHTHESTRKLGRRIELGTAQIVKATVRFERGRWLVSFTCAVRRADGRQSTVAASGVSAVVGIDAGVKDLLVVAGPDGTEIARHTAPGELKRALRKLRALQRKAARQRGPWNAAAQQKQDASRGWESTLAEITRAHARVANLRADRIHKLTTSLAKTHQVIGGGTLAVKNMMRRPKPKPDPDNPGARGTAPPPKPDSTGRWLMPALVRCFANSTTKHAGMDRIWSKPTDGSPAQKCVPAVVR